MTSPLTTDQTLSKKMEAFGSRSWIVVAAMVFISESPTIAGAVTANLWNLKIERIVLARGLDFTQPCRAQASPDQSALAEPPFGPYGRLVSMNRWRTAARYAWLRGACDFAAESWERASASGDGTVSLFYLGWMAQNAGDHRRAITLWKSAQAGLYFGRTGLKLQRAGDLVNAKATLEIAADIEADSFEIWRGLAEVDGALGKKAESSEAWARASQTVSRTSPFFWWAKAFSAFARDDLDSARAAFEQGAQMIGGGWEVRLLEEAGVMLHGAGRLDEAEEVYRRVIELAPTRVYAYLYTAGAEASRGHDELAAQWYAKVIDVEPNNAEACRYLTRFTAENPKNQAASESVSKCRPR